MQTIEVTGTVRPPRHIEEKLSDLTSIKECMDRQRDLNARFNSIQREIDELQEERNEVESERYWLKHRFEQILQENPAEAEEWAYIQAVRNPNQQKLNLSAAVPVQ